MYEKDNVKKAFVGVRSCIVGLIAFGAYQITTENVVDLKSAAIFLVGFGSLFIKKVDPIYVIILSALVGIIIY